LNRERGKKKEKETKHQQYKKNATIKNSSARAIGGTGESIKRGQPIRGGEKKKRT